MLLIKPLLAFRPNRSDWIFAVKTFIAGMLALYVAFLLNLAYPIWVIGTVFVIANPFAGMVASKSVYRALGTLLGAVVSVAVTPWLINTPWLFTCFLALWVGLCLYISLLDRTPRSYIFMLAGYTAIIIIFNILYNPETASLFDMAVGRVLEILVGVVCSAIVSASIFPVHVGPVITARVSKTLKDTQGIFDKILTETESTANYSQLLSHLARDIADIHVMAIHLNHEKSRLQGMTRPLQEMLNQISLLVANLVAMSERIKQLDQIDRAYWVQLQALHQEISAFIQQPCPDEQLLNTLPEQFESLYTLMASSACAEQQVMLQSLKMDLRHFIQNIRAIQLIWQRIQQGDASLPEAVAPMNTAYPYLHRDHGVAWRGGITAFLVVFISTGLWILSGWKAGFMFAEMAAISACILTSMDNPVPALKMFIRGNIYAAFIVFIYAYGIFPTITDFWQLTLVMAPFIIACLLLFPHPPLTGIALPVLMGTIMGLNFQNRYVLDPIFFFDATIGTILGPVLSVYMIHLVRAMSPDITAKRILSLHDQALSQALVIPYGPDFRVHLRSMLDRIGVLNTKAVQSEELKQQIQRAIIEVSATVDLARVQEIIKKFKANHSLTPALEQFLQQLDEFFMLRSRGKQTEPAQQALQQQLAQLQHSLNEAEPNQLTQRLAISLNNIQSSLCGDPAISLQHEATAWVK